MASKDTEHADDDQDENGEGHEEDGAAGQKKGKRKLLIIAAAAIVLLVGAAGAMLTMGGGDDEHAAVPEPQKVVVEAPVYYELPQFLVNLNTANGRVSFLKMSVTLELRNEASVAVVDANKPRILDTFNTYLRELRSADVQGSSGIYRLRDELMARLNTTIEEGLVKDILFSEIIVQ